jgi:hypothetical protein
MREFYGFVWRSSASQQIILIILAAVAAVLAAAPLELQRHIINTLAGHEKAERLALLCGGYLLAAVGISGLKYAVNIKSSGLGEAMIRSLRETIFRDRPLSLRVFGRLPFTGVGPHGGRRPKSLEGGNRGGVRTDAGVDLWGICRRRLV